jgi:hypothetical protein
MIFYGCDLKQQSESTDLGEGRKNVVINEDHC